MADVKMVERVYDHINEDMAVRMAQVEIGDTGVLLTVNGKPIMVIEVDTIEDGIQLNIVIHEKADRDCINRHSTVEVRMREGFECSVPHMNPSQPTTHTGCGTPDEAAKAHQESLKEEFGVEVPLSQIVVKELTIDY